MSVLAYAGAAASSAVIMSHELRSKKNYVCRRRK